MPNYPMAYHITWGTYGTRLPGSDKPYVDRWHNEYKKPLPKRTRNENKPLVIE